MRETVLWMLLLATGALWTAGAAQALPMNPSRPVAPLGDNGFEDTLQETFDALGTGPGIDAVADQDGQALFALAGDRSVATLAVEIAGFADQNVLGIYSAADPTVRAEIFGGSDGAGHTATVSFLGDDLYVEGVLAAAGFGNAFGFFVATPQGNTFHTEDDRNPGGAAHALAYPGDGATTFAGILLGPDTWVFAFEDVPLATSDRDYQDLVFVADGLVRSDGAGNPPEVPEPGSIALLASVLAALARGRR